MDPKELINYQNRLFCMLQPIFCSRICVKSTFQKNNHKYFFNKKIYFNINQCIYVHFKTKKIKIIEIFFKIVLKYGISFFFFGFTIENFGFVSICRVVVGFWVKEFFIELRLTF